MTKKLLFVVIATVFSAQGALAYGAKTSAEIEAQLQEAQEKTRISILKDEINDLRFKLEVLEDIADPSVIATYRSYKGTISLTASAAAMFTSVAFVQASVGSPVVPKKSAILGVAALGLALHGILSLEDQQKYNQLKEDYLSLSIKDQLALYREFTLKTQADLNELDQELK